MGNNSCTLAIHTDKQIATPGSFISGKVFLSVNIAEGISGVQQSLGIRFYGEEFAKIHDALSDADNCARSTVPVCECQHPISFPSNTGGHIPSGQYEFPFEFQLPSNLPSSMRSTMDGSNNCHIRYEISAHIMRTGNNGFGFGIGGNREISSEKKQISIFGDPDLAMIHSGPIDLPPTTSRINCCCCINKGSMTMSSSISNTLMVPQQSYLISFSLLNNSSVAVKGVRVHLFERVEWRAEGRRQIQLKLLNQEYCDGRSLDSRIEMGVSRSEVSYSEIPRQREVRFVIPTSANDTYAGRIIQVQHWISIKVITPCCMTDPDSTIDVTITRQGPPFEGQLGASTAGGYIASTQQGVQYPNQHDNPPSTAPLLETNVTEAEVLPPDWIPITAEVITIPAENVTIVSEIVPSVAQEPLTRQCQTILEQ